MSGDLARLYTPGEAGRKLGCSASTIKRLAEYLRIEPYLTNGGSRLFTTEQIDRIKTERERRAEELVRR